jgi:hypothetical protein
MSNKGEKKMAVMDSAGINQTAKMKPSGESLLPETPHSCVALDVNL